MIGDKHCDAACNISQCFWDNLDCGCAPKCNFEDYGSCKAECLVPNCNYDSMSGYTVCADEGLRTAAKYYQLAKGNFTLGYAKASLCSGSVCDWTTSLTSCVPACNIAECGMSFTNCVDSPTSCSLLPNCQTCPLTSFSGCLKCVPGTLHLFTTCVLKCPNGYYPHPLVTDLCYPMDDSTSASSPLSIYVTANGNPTGVGTYTDPYESIALAMDSLRMRFSVIYLLAGIHKLTATALSPYIKKWTQAATTATPYSSFNVTIKGFTCALDSNSPPHSQCAHSNPVLQLDNLNPVLIRIVGTVKFVGVDIYGNSTLLAGCSSPLCTYCPNVTSDAFGNSVNDRNAILAKNSFAPASLCTPFLTKAFITIDSGAGLYFDNLTFAEFREGYPALITLTSAWLSFQSVVFSNILIAMKSPIITSTTFVPQEAVISQTNPGSDLYLTGKISLRNVLVTLLNNGYEFSVDQSFGGFLNVRGLHTIEILNSNFTLSTVPRSILINVGNLLRFIMRNCLFDTLYSGQNLIRITSIITISTLADAYLDHIVIGNTTFARCSASHPKDAVGYIVLIVYNSPQINALVENITLTDTFSIASAFAIINFGTILSNDRTGYSVVTRTTTSRIVSSFPQKWIKFRNVNCTTGIVISVSLGLIYISGVVNVEVSNLTILNSGDYLPNESVNTKTFQHYRGQPGVYQTRLAPDLLRTHCSKIVNFQRAFNITIGDVLISNCQCLDSTGSTGLNAGGAMTGDFIVARFKMTSSVSVSSSLGNCVNAVSSGNVFVSKIEMRDNVMGAGGCVKITGSTALLNSVTKSTFVNNTSQGAMVQVTGYAFTFTENLIETTTSNSQAGIFFQASPGLTSAKLNITGNTFRRNTASVGTIVYVTNDLTVASAVLLIVQNCEFSNNVADTAASVLFIDTTNPMFQGSVVSQNSFKNNTSFRGVISVAYRSGTLLLDSNTFEDSKVINHLPLTGKIGPDVGCIEVLFQLQTVLLPSLKIHSCIFHNNQGSSVIKFLSQNERTIVNITQCEFFSNSGRSVSIERGLLLTSQTTYKNNTGGAFFVSQGASVVADSNTMMNNSGFWAGVAYFGGTSSGSFVNCTIEKNTGTNSAGAFFVEQSSVIAISNSSIRRNVANVRGSAIFLFGTTADNHISDTLIEENESLDAASIMCVSSRLTMTRVTITRNRAPVAAGVLAYISTLVVTDCVFAEQHSNSGTFLYSAIDSLLVISGSQFYLGIADSVGGAIYLNSARVTITGSRFRDIQAQAGALLYGDANSSIAVRTSDVQSVYSVGEQGGVVVINDGQTVISHTDIAMYENGGLVVIGRSTVSLVGVHFSYGNNTQGGAVYCSDCISLVISSSVFANISAIDGAALYFTRQKTQISPFLIDSCWFSNLTGVLSGAIFLSNIDLQVSSSQFESLQATGIPQLAHGDGGAVKALCPDITKECRVSVQDSVFSDNSASYRGGSIYWDRCKPALRNNTFMRGSALYGVDMASFPVGIRVSQVTGNASVETLGSDANNVRIEGVLHNLASGQICEHTVAVQLLDHYGQVVATDTGTSATILVDSTVTSVFGTINAYSVNGSFSFSGFGVAAPPGQSTLIYVSAASVNSVGNETIGNVLALRAEMRQCTIGESLTGIQCVVCSEGKFSLDPSESCQPCPPEAICYGNFTMVPQAGYWRSSKLSTVFWQCPYENACVGSPEPPDPLSYTGLCSKGYYGNLCNGCISGFSRENKAECSVCPSLITNSIKISGIGLAVLFVVSIIVKMAITSARKSSSHYSIFIKILLNYLHLIMLTASFQLDWPSYVKELFRVQESAGNVSEQAFSIDCFLDSSSVDSQASTVRTKLLGFAFLPVGLLALTLVFWLPLSLIRRKSYYKSELVATNVILFFLVHPNIVKVMFAFYNCRQLDPGQFWLDSYLNIPCWDEVHYRYALVVALPSIVVWGIGIPLVCLAVLIRNSNRLALFEMKMRLGFVYTGYDPSRFYWEFVILYRKIAIICVSVFLSTISISVQGLTVMLILLASFGLQVKHRPYVIQTMNDLEVRAILVASVTIYCGLFYMTSKLDSATKLVMFAVIVTSNAYFVCFWVAKVTKAAVEVLTRRFPCLTRLFGKLYRIQSLKVSSPLGSSAVGATELAKSSELPAELSRVSTHADPRLGNAQRKQLPPPTADRWCCPGPALPSA